ncbi:MAG: hypothetical protein PWP65_793 [Clostridia bacterium]|nr:hypothetical protein [Clostridia bacterium]
MKRIFYKLLPAACSFLVLAAAMGVKPTCTLFWYQPEVPEALRK